RQLAGPREALDEHQPAAEHAPDDEEGDRHSGARAEDRVRAFAAKNAPCKEKVEDQAPDAAVRRSMRERHASTCEQAVDALAAQGDPARLEMSPRVLEQQHLG